MNFNRDNDVFAGVINIHGPYFSFKSLQCYLCPWLLYWLL